MPQPSFKVQNTPKGKDGPTTFFEWDEVIEQYRKLLPQKMIVLDPADFDSTPARLQQLVKSALAHHNDYRNTRLDPKPPLKAASVCIRSRDKMVLISHSTRKRVQRKKP